MLRAIAYESSAAWRDAAVRIKYLRGSKGRNELRLWPVPCNGNRHGATRIEAANRFVQRGNVDCRRHDRHRHLHLDRRHRRDLAIAWWYVAGVALRWTARSYRSAQLRELSASLPYAGGDYIYIREAYGKLMGFCPVGLLS